MLYEIEKLKMTYGKRDVLDLDHLAFKQEKIIGLLGPNGAGKTTLLEILAFILTPSTGLVRYEKKSVDYRSPGLVKLRQEVVLVQQKLNLCSTSVSKNVGFPLKIRKIPKEKRGEIVEELLGLVGMEEFRDSQANRLSGGETQRVAIAQALACSPEVILMDEPTASVDVENQITIERIIREINRERKISVIFTTHDMTQASRVADEIVFMFEGKVGGSIYENIFSGQIETDTDGRNYCTIQNGFRLRVKTEKTGTVRLSIDPGGMEIGRELNGSLKENCFKGRLVQLTDEKDRVRAMVDVGIPLSILVSKDHFNALHIGIGEELWLTCPAEGLEVF